MAALTEHGAAPNTAPNGLAEHGKDAHVHHRKIQGRDDRGRAKPHA